MKLKVNQSADEFFTLYGEAATTLHSATDALKDLIDNYEDVEIKAGRIMDLEHEGDEITHAIIKKVNTMFITPMDREDIYSLATSLDDVLDEIEAVAQLFVLHNIEAPLPQMKLQVDILLRAVIQTEEAIKALPKMKREVLEPYWIEINRLENEGDEVYRHAIAELFSGDYKAMDVLKWKEIIEDLERATDYLENVANVIEATVLKHA
ncbi:MAG: DUF47 family protein [Actinobacteria bacterium]|nr:DUF47 family protein [Actinomycetota bacterium]